MALTLKYDFATDKSLVADTGPTLSITRTTSATYFDVSGVLQTAATGVARFDHDPVTNESLGLLIEEARTNLINYSNDWTNWSAGSGGTTTTAAAATSPDGTTNATELAIIDSGQDREICNNITTSTATDYTCSCFIKNVDSTRTQFRVWSLTDSGNTSILNVAWTGAVPSTFNATNAANVTYQDVGDNWYRVSYTWTTSGTSVSENLNLHPAITGTGTESIYVYGAQIEEASFPSSYIATSGATATRNADQVNTTTLSWLDAAASAAGTWYVKGQYGYVSAAARSVLTLDDDGTTDRQAIELDAAENINFATTHSADTDGLVSGTAVIAAQTTFQVAASYADDDIIAAIDGTLESGDATAAFPLADNPTTLRVGYDSTGLQLNGHIAELRYYDERLANATLQSLSTDGSIVDDLLADDVESASELTTPTVGQTHALTSVSVESASELTSPALVEVISAHTLLADDIQSFSQVSTPTLNRSDEKPASGSVSRRHSRDDNEVEMIVRNFLEHVA